MTPHHFPECVVDTVDEACPLQVEGLLPGVEQLDPLEVLAHHPRQGCFLRGRGRLGMVVDFRDPQILLGQGRIALVGLAGDQRPGRGAQLDGLSTRRELPVVAPDDEAELRPPRPASAPAEILRTIHHVQLPDVAGS